MKAGRFRSPRTRKAEGGAAATTQYRLAFRVGVALFRMKSTLREECRKRGRRVLEKLEGGISPEDGT